MCFILADKRVIKMCSRNSSIKLNTRLIRLFPFFLLAPYHNSIECWKSSIISALDFCSFSQLLSFSLSFGGWDEELCPTRLWSQRDPVIVVVCAYTPLRIRASASTVGVVASCVFSRARLVRLRGCTVQTICRDLWWMLPLGCSTQRNPDRIRPNSAMLRFAAEKKNKNVTNWVTP